MALAAAGVQIDPHRERGQRLRRVRVHHVRLAGAVAVLALDVVVAGIAGREPAALPLRGITKLVIRMATLAELLRVTAVLQGIPGVRVRRGDPGRRLPDVALPTHRPPLVRWIARHVTHVAGRARRRIVEERPLDEDDLLVRAGRKKQKDAQEEGGPR